MNFIILLGSMLLMLSISASLPAQNNSPPKETPKQTPSPEDGAPPKEPVPGGEKPIKPPEAPGADTEKPIKTPEAPDADGEKPIKPPEAPDAGKEKPIKTPEAPGKDGEKPIIKPPQRSKLNLNLINHTGKPVYIRAKVQLAGDPTQFMEAQGLSEDLFTTIATFHADPHKEFELINFQKSGPEAAGAAQLVIAENKGLNITCKIVEEAEKEKGKKRAKKSIDFYVSKGENESYPSCYILFDYEP